MATVCAIPGCGGPVDGGPDVATTLPLCAIHLRAAADEAADRFGVTDVLPSPCPACGSRLGVQWPSGWLCAVCEWRWGEHPDGDAVPPRVDIVYYLRLGDRIKIGTTANPRQRLAALPWDEVLAFERGDRVLEQRRHREFAALRLGTSEWFAAGDAIVEHARMLGAGALDPWNVYARWVSEQVAMR